MIARISILLFITFSFFIRANGQSCVDSTGRAFNFYSIGDVNRGCVPLEAAFDDSTENLTSVFFLPDNNLPPISSNFIQPGTNYIYEEPGFYDVVINGNLPIFDSSGNQIAQIAVTCIIDSMIEVLDTVTPKVDIFPCDQRRLIIEANNTPYEQIIIEFNDPANTIDTIKLPNPESAVVQYSSLGAKSIRLEGRYLPGNCGVDTTVIFNDLINNLPDPFLDSIVNFSDSIGLYFNGSTLSSFVIQRKVNPSGSFLNLDTLKGTDSLMVYYDTSAISGNDYSYQILRLDKCNFTESSNTTSSIYLQGVISFDSRNTLNWIEEAQDQPDYYVISRNGYPIDSISSDNSSTYSFADTPVYCGATFTYQIKGIYNNGAVSFSNKSISRSFSSLSPPGFDFFLSTFSNDSLILFWEISENVAVESYNAQKTFNGNLENIAVNKASELFFDPINLDETENVCYFLSFTDSCGNSMIRADTTCPVILQISEFTELGYPLDWSEFIGYDLEVASYDLLVKNSEGDIIDEITLSSSLNYTLDPSIYSATLLTLQIRANPIGNEPLVFSNSISIEPQSNLIVPNIFTPNGDGRNDEFRVYAPLVKEYEIRIFNRSGVPVFESKNPDEVWDGSVVDGNIQAQQVFAYVIKATSIAGEEIIKKGTITLIR